jgi:hypothetical protein
MASQTETNVRRITSAAICRRNHAQFAAPLLLSKKYT